MKRSKKIVLVNIGLVVCVVVLVLLGISVWTALLPFILALALSYLIDPAVKMLGEKGVPVGWSLLVIYLYIIIGLYALGVFVLPNIIGEIDTLMKAIPEFIAQGEAMLQNLFPNGASLLPSGFDSTELATKITGYMQERLSGFSVNPEDSFTYMIAIVFAPILSYYILRDKEIFKNKIVSFLPPKERPEILRISSDVNHIVRQFIYGYLFVAAIIGIISGVVLALMGVPYALVLGVIIGLFDLIPYFGPFISIAISMAFALLESPTLALYTLIVLAAIQQFESMVLSPKIIGSRTGLHPLTTILVVLAGGHWFGMIGMVLAVPVAAALKLIISFIYSRLVAFKEQNGDEVLEKQTGLTASELDQPTKQQIIDNS